MHFFRNQIVQIWALYPPIVVYAKNVNLFNFGVFKISSEALTNRINKLNKLPNEKSRLMKFLSQVYRPFLFELIMIFCLNNSISAAMPDSTANEPNVPAVDSVDKKSLGAGLNGGLQVSNLFYFSSLDSAYRSPYSYVLSGNFNLTYKSISLPFSFVISEQDRSFRQPFNQFGASPKYKWITVHAGYRNITFSPYTLAGHTFLGGGVELTPGKLRFGAVYGRFVKAVRADSVLVLPGQSAYDRYALSIKLGLGSATNYCDLIYLKGWDDPNAVLDNSDTLIARPAINTVIGFTMYEKMGKHLLLKINTAASVYTNDVNGTSEEVTDPNLAKIVKAFNINSTSQYHYAMDGSFGYTSPIFGLGVAYKRISPDYKSMGLYFITNDVEQYTIVPTINAWKRKIHVTGSIGFEHDNISNNRAYQTKRVIGSAVVSVNPNPIFGITGNFYNYSVGQVEGIRTLSDTIRLAQVNKGITITPRLMLGTKKLRHVILFTYDRRNLDDKNIYTESYTEYKTGTQFLNYSISHIDAGWSVSASLNNNKITSAVVNTGYKGFSVGASKSFFNNNLNAGINTGYNIINQNEISGNHLISYNANLSYRFFKKHVVSFYGYSNNYTSAIPTSPSYTDYTLRIQYQYLFSKKSII